MSTITNTGDGEQPQPKLVLSPSEAMDVLGVSKATLFKLLRTKELDSILLGPRIRKIRIEAIREYLDRKSAEAADTETRQAS